MYNYKRIIKFLKNVYFKEIFGGNMSKISDHVGSKIRMYRKERGMTLQELADSIHKSRASVSKYENGEIIIDIETLYEIANILQVDLKRLIDYRSPVLETKILQPETIKKSPFFQAKRLYFYFYDGRYRRLKDGIIDVYETEDEPGNYEASFSISSISPTGRSSEIYYAGRVVYSDMLIRFSFVNQCNTLEEDLLYIFNPLDIRDSTDGLLCGISSADLKPCAFKCLVTLTPREHSDELKERLLITKNDLKKWQKLNMMLVDNMG